MPPQLVASAASRPVKEHSIVAAYSTHTILGMALNNENGDAMGSSRANHQLMHLIGTEQKGNGRPQGPELLSRFRTQKLELVQLRRQLADASIKELQLLNEKHILEKRYAGMRLDLDQQQNELLAAASQALSHRKTKLEENMNLSQKLLAAEHERSIFLSSLLGLLADNDLQPVVVNASTIVRNVQVLLQNLREKLAASSGGQYLSRTTITNHQISPKLDLQALGVMSNHDHHSPANSTTVSLYPQHLYQYNYCSESTVPSIPKFISVPDGRSGTLLQTSSPHTLTLNSNMLDAASSRINSYSDGFTFASENTAVRHLEDQRTDFNDKPLVPVQEGQLLPGINDLQISGEARLTCTIQACGYPFNGTTVCMFQWVYLEDQQYIDVEGATYPEYLLTADDVDKIIAVHCIPVDSFGNQGEVAMAFANNGQKIPLDPDVEQEIEAHLSSAKAVFEVLLLKEPSETWEKVILVLDRFGFKVNSSNPAYAIEEEYPTFESVVIIPNQDRKLCILRSLNGDHQLKTNLRSRDILVITMRNFQHQALERKRAS